MDLLQEIEALKATPFPISDEDFAKLKEAWLMGPLFTSTKEDFKKLNLRYSYHSDTGDCYLQGAGILYFVAFMDNLLLDLKKKYSITLNQKA